MIEFLKKLLLTIWDLVLLLLTIFVFIGTPIVFLIAARQFMSNIDALLLFFIASSWGICFPTWLKHVGCYSTSLYRTLKGEPNE